MILNSFLGNLYLLQPTGKKQIIGFGYHDYSNFPLTIQSSTTVSLFPPRTFVGGSLTATLSFSERS
jgi:hypothetical protein